MEQNRHCSWFASPPTPPDTVSGAATDYPCASCPIAASRHSGGCPDRVRPTTPDAAPRETDVCPRRSPPIIPQARRASMSGIVSSSGSLTKTQELALYLLLYLCQLLFQKLHLRPILLQADTDAPGVADLPRANH